ncbi:MAG: hypothetical protein HY928_07885 [Elusimicrobia bacterium]|nr:hypothetical protein [Elusimicrobiota bacterium]
MVQIPPALSLLLLLAGPAASAGALDLPVPAIGPSARIERPLTDYYLVSRPEFPAPPPAAEPGRDDSSLRSPRQLTVWVSEPAEDGSAWNILKGNYRDQTRAAAQAYLARLCLRAGWAGAEVEDMACEERPVGIASRKWECDVYSSCSKPVRGDLSRISVDGETWESKSELLARVWPASTGSANAGGAPGSSSIARLAAARRR